MHYLAAGERGVITRHRDRNDRHGTGNALGDVGDPVADPLGVGPDLEPSVAAGSVAEPTPSRHRPTTFAALSLARVRSAGTCRTRTDRPPRRGAGAPTRTAGTEAYCSARRKRDAGRAGSRRRPPGSAGFSCC